MHNAQFYLNTKHSTQERDALDRRDADDERVLALLADIGGKKKKKKGRKRKKRKTASLFGDGNDDDDAEDDGDGDGGDLDDDDSDSDSSDILKESQPPSSFPIPKSRPFNADEYYKQKIQLNRAQDTIARLKERLNQLSQDNAELRKSKVSVERRLILGNVVSSSRCTRLLLTFYYCIR